MNKVRIVGICLVKNEELYIERVLKNTLDFCDEIIVLDNNSEDKTYDILSKLADSNSKIKLQKIDNAYKSHKFVEKFADTLTWLFRIDGDEIYDPMGLQKLREELLAGKYLEFWRVEGTALNCTELDFPKGTASGYTSPPSKNVARLYNFSGIKSWIEPNGQRLHGKNAVYKPGYDYYACKTLSDDKSWDTAIFRCLHICFIKRSSSDKSGDSPRNPRENRNIFRKTLNLARNLASGKLNGKSNYKNIAYKKGEFTTKRLEQFFQ
jgi:glycosyltransferase involved in cell wall biosynthesis